MSEKHAAPPGTPSPASASGRPQPVIALREAIALIVGIVIGAGIFAAPAMVAGMTGSAPWMFGAWLLGGLMSLIGALCYAELATAYSHAGGDYHFLRRAYGRSVAFLFGWARFSVITTGSIALLGFVFGDYMNQVWPIGGFGILSGPTLYAAVSIVILSFINMRSTMSGTYTQTWLTALEVGGLLIIVAAALYLAGTGTPPATLPAADAPAGVPSAAAFGLAMVFVLLTFGGWNEAAYISAELRDGRRGIVKALIWSIVIITAVYMLVIWAYWRALGIEGMANSQAMAADVLGVAFGPVGAMSISLMVAVAALTSMNATMIVGARTNYAVGQDWHSLKLLSHWDDERDAPLNALRVQTLAALLLVLVGAWTGAGFRSMVEFTAPVFWLFFLLSGVSLFVLRYREPNTERPFKVPLYPLLPLVFCAMCAYMLWSSLSYVYSQSLGGLNAAWIGVGVLAIGLVLLLLVRAQHARQQRSAVKTF
ncbi:MAG TPA: amino acid permease [Noviherbaspirillum sp.]|nr:amino acid permease [Noviherbaspirillum sp.]